MKRCIQCNSRNLIMDNAIGELFCANCGYVITEHIEDHSKEWRSFNKEGYEDRSRTGIPNSLAMHDMGLATVIGKDKDATVKPYVRLHMRSLKLVDGFGTYGRHNQIVVKESC